MCTRMHTRHFLAYILYKILQQPGNNDRKDNHACCGVWSAAMGSKGFAKQRFKAESSMLMAFVRWSAVIHGSLAGWFK